MNLFCNSNRIKISLLLLVVMITLPFYPVFANFDFTEEPEPDKESFFQSIGNAIDYMQMDFLRDINSYQTRSLMNIFSYQEREKLPIGELVENELAKALQSLNDFGVTIFKDERLSEAVNDIIMDLLDEEDFTRGVQQRKEFISDIIRDPRLIKLLGEVISDYLKDEKMAEDIEFFLTIILDLIADKDIQNYIKETVARLIENPQTARLFDGIMGAVAQVIYNTATGTISDLTSGENEQRIKNIIKDVTAIFIDPVPEMIAGVVEDRRVKDAAEDVLRVLIASGPTITADILDDKTFQSLVSDMVLYAMDFALSSSTSVMRDDNLGELIKIVAGNAAEAVDTGLITNIFSTLVNDFFTTGEFRAFVDPGFQYMMLESQIRAKENTLGDTFYIPTLDLGLNLGKEIAWGVAEVPLEIVYLGFFDWMVYGKDDLPAKTYSEWVAEFTNLINGEMVEEIGEALSVTINKTLPRIIEENKECLFSDIKEILEDLPYEEASVFLWEDETINTFPAILAETVLSYVPFDFIAETFREEDDIVRVIKEVSGEIVDDFPLEAVGQFIQDDTRITDLLEDATPSLPLSEIAALIRTDDRIWDIITGIAREFPVIPISRFLQGELRADIIGETIASLLLNLVADFVETSQLTDFAHDTIMDIMESFDEPFAKMILDSVARAFENDQIAPFLSASVVGVVRETQPELKSIFKIVVPRFFTRLLFG